MPVGITVLQLDTRFPRIPGDVGCPETYQCEVEVLRVPKATVAQVVTDDPKRLDIAPFEMALARARGKVIVTSCGFLSAWQDYLQALTERPVITSSLIALPELAAQNDRHGIAILTFDAQRLNAAHMPGWQGALPLIIGLDPNCHLRRVIETDALHLDVDRAEREVLELLRDRLPSSVKALLIECTNIVPYRVAIAREFGIQVVDTLSCIHAVSAAAIRPKWLG